MFGSKKRGLPSAEEAPPRTRERMPVPRTHFVTGAVATAVPAGTERAVFGMVCFWARRRSSGDPGVYSTSVGLRGGHTPNPDL